MDERSQSYMGHVKFLLYHQSEQKQHMLIRVRADEDLKRHSWKFKYDQIATDVKNKKKKSKQSFVYLPKEEISPNDLQRAIVHNGLLI